MAETSNRQLKSKNTNKAPRFQSSEHILQKQKAHKLDKRENVIYVGSKSNIRGLVEKCDKLIRKDEQEIIIYCMGAAIQRGILLALQVCEKHIAFNLSVNTTTVELIDEFEPTTDEADYELLIRNNSSLQIKVFRTQI